ncbi:MAG: hypothetical protein LH609_21945 [Rudanella sp.]|nr:hypothetical protein [Rudanella sp.]
MRNRLLRRLSEAARWADETPEPVDEFSVETAWLQEEIDAETGLKLQRALQELTPRQRESIQLKFLDERSYDEIADLLRGVLKRLVW